MPNYNPTVAVVINEKARYADSLTFNYIRDNIMDEKLYVCASLGQMRETAKKIVEKQFDAVILGGGDGTFSLWVTEIMNLQPKKLPAFGILRLGTGNGMAEALGAGPLIVGPFGARGFAEEMARAKDPAARIQKTMLKIGNRYAPFAGMGLDAFVLDDYGAIRSFLDKVPFLPKKGRGAFDYALAITTVSFWRYATNPLPHVVVRNGAGKAYRIDFNGLPISLTKPSGEAISKLPGEILYRGPASIVSASTIPYYGWGVRVFPQADKTIMSECFQLRISAMDVFETLFQLPALFLGKMAHEKLWDFACQEITVEVLNIPENNKYAKGLPLQISGDPAGRHKKVKIELEKILAVRGAASAAPEPSIK